PFRVYLLLFLSYDNVVSMTVPGERSADEDVIDRWLVLRTLSAASKAPGSTLIQKVFFVAEHKLVGDGIGVPSFGFLRHRWGPYSKELAVTVDELHKSGLLHANHTLTPRAREIVEHWDGFWKTQAPSELRAAERQLEGALREFEHLNVKRELL